MKISVGLAALLLLPLGALRAGVLPPSAANQQSDAATAKPASSDDVGQTAEAYYDFTLDNLWTVDVKCDQLAHTTGRVA